jgi:hypothetical protein
MNFCGSLAQSPYGSNPARWWQRERNARTERNFNARSNDLQPVFAVIDYASQRAGLRIFKPRLSS